MIDAVDAHDVRRLWRGLGERLDRAQRERLEPQVGRNRVEVAVPDDIDPADVDRALAEIAASEVVEVSLRELETHEL